MARAARHALVDSIYGKHLAPIIIGYAFMTDAEAFEEIKEGVCEIITLSKTRARISAYMLTLFWDDDLDGSADEDSSVWQIHLEEISRERESFYMPIPDIIEYANGDRTHVSDLTTDEYTAFDRFGYHLRKVLDEIIYGIDITREREHRLCHICGW
jgi:hypothetical protein